MKKKSFLILLTALTVSLSSCTLEKVNKGSGTGVTLSEKTQALSTTAAAQPSKGTEASSSASVDTLSSSASSEGKTSGTTKTADPAGRAAALAAITKKQKDLRYVEQYTDFSIDQPASYKSTQLEAMTLYNDDLSAKEFYSAVTTQTEGSKTDLKKTNMMTYAVNGKIYGKKDAGAWYAADGPLAMDTTYYPILKSFFAAETYLDFDDSNPDEWVFHFEGKNKDLLATFRSIYALNFSGIDESQLELTVTYTFEPESAYLRSAEHNIYYAKGGDTLEIYGYSGFYMYDLFDEVEVPADFKQP